MTPIDKPPPSWSNEPTAVTKEGVAAIASALGLQVRKTETTKQLVRRCVDAAVDLRRQLELAVRRPSR